MASVTQYADRKIDLLAFVPSETGVGHELQQQLVSETNAGYATAGIQKLAQRFVLALLLEAGSIRHFPDRGCAFMSEARAGYFQTSLDVFTAFRSAMVDVERQLLADERDTDPDDEKFRSSELQSVTLAGTSLSLTVQITSQAGSSYTFIQPIAVGV